jgi:tRNA pseudouridine32 synthase/23S rRNA pseudouridine746 synthase
MAVSRLASKLSLPTREGVGASSIVLPPGAWPTILDFLIERFPGVPREEILRRSQAGDVLNHQGAPLDALLPYAPGARLFYYRHVENEPAIAGEETILFQDDFLVVADKPHGLPMSPVGAYAKETLLARLKRRTGIATLAPMHRLDRETAGVVAFTVKPESRGAYQRLFAGREVEKSYEAVAPFSSDLGFPLVARHRIVAGDHFMRMCVADGEPNAETRIELIEPRGAMARYALFPATGKKHQLRVQMAALGLPILNDTLYPVMCDDVPDPGAPLQLLSRSLAFRDPITGAMRIFNSLRQLDWISA